jgi:hypothetical protein
MSAERIKVKTLELSGVALDWAVETIEFDRRLAQGEHVKSWVLEQHAEGSTHARYSEDWLWSGEIFAREIQEFRREPDGTFWAATETFQAGGPTPIVAALRAYAASQVGLEVEIPRILAPEAQQARSPRPPRG